MKVNPEKCTGCTICLPYCNVGAISMQEGKAVVDNAVCVECWVCHRNRICPREAFEPTPLKAYGDLLKHVLSDPTVTSKGTGVPGRGTEEAKTNDITGRYSSRIYGIAIDMGRPGVGCYLRDVEKVAMALAGAGLKFAGADETPLSVIMTDLSTGKIQDDLLDTHLLSIIIEGTCEKEKLPGILEAVKRVGGEIDTVFTLGIVSAHTRDHDETLMRHLEEAGLGRPLRGKVNVGLGRPLFVETGT